MISSFEDFLIWCLVWINSVDLALFLFVIVRLVWFYAVLKFLINGVYFVVSLLV